VDWVYCHFYCFRVFIFQLFNLSQKCYTSHRKKTSLSSQIS
jgi:hypothetical protein